MFSMQRCLGPLCLLAQCLWCLAGWSATGHAEEPPAPAVAEEDQLAQQDAEDAPTAPQATAGSTVAADDGRTRIGPFVLDADLLVSQGYTDNVYATRNDKVGDALTIVTPSLSLDSEGLPVELELFGSAEIGRYWDETTEDYEDFNFGLDTTYRFTPQSSVFGGASFGRDHEERQSPDDVAGTEPTLYYDSQAYLGTAHRIGDVTLRAGGTYERLDFSDVDAAGGEINNDDRDRDLYTAGARVGYIVAPGYEVFGQGLFDLRDYDEAQDDNGFARDSEGFSAAAGLHYRPNRNLDIEGALGLLQQSYDDPGFDTTTEFDFALRAFYRPQATTRLSAFVDRSLQETTLSGTSGYISTGYGLALIQQVRPDISFETSMDYYESDYKGLKRQDSTFDLGIGARYYFLPNFFLATNYSFLLRDSTVASEDYDEHQVFFSLGAELSPAYSEDELGRSPEIIADLGGLYGGLQGSLTNLGTELSGPRGGTGSLTSELADFGLGGGAFTGYAIRAGDWQFGLEIDAEVSNAEWAHTRDMGGRAYSVEKNWSVAAGPLVGYWLNDDSMIYGRFGVVETSFDTGYVETGTEYGESRSLTGLRFGLGAETTLSGNFFLRLDYSYTDYEDYDITFSDGRDNFANNESLVRLGVGYRLPGSAPEADDAKEEEAAPDPAGFYIGAGGGHNRLNSKNTGDREAGSLLAVDAGEGGASGGFFAGYGAVWRNIYLGAEAEAELSDVTWEREREPTGRVFEVDKEGGIGAGLRAGYVLPGGALAYGRAGVMYSKFDTQVTTTGNHFEESEFLLGLRVGMGLELPITEDVFARLEYSYTEYEKSSLATSGGPEDFENSEGLFRAAIGWRF